MSANRDVAGNDRPRDAAELLRRTDRTLGAVIEEVLGTRPALDVVAQWRLVPPLGAWLAPPLSDRGDLLGRCTGYRMDDLRLSRHVAYVDLSRVPPEVAADLESGRVNLGQLLAENPSIEKEGFRFGLDTDADAGEFEGVLRTWFGEDGLRPYVWRRYVGRMRGTVAMLIVETLPTEAWDGLLGSQVPTAPGERA